MWFGTDEGLNRYDGKELIVFKNIPRDSSSLSGNEIHDLFEDRDGIIWIATGDGGLSSYNYQKGKFRQYHIHISGSDGSVANSINAIAQKGEDKLWIATDKAGLYLFDKKRGTFQILSQTISGINREYANKAYSYFDLATDSIGNTYFGTLTFSLLVARTDSFPVTKAIKEYPYPANSINCIFIDNKKRVWLGAWDNALHEYNAKTNSPDKIGAGISTILLNKNDVLTYSGDEIISINEDQKEWLWLGSRHSGLYLFNPITKEIFNQKKNLGDPGSLSSNTVRCIYRDNANRMWVGTDAGIDIYDPLLNQFEVVPLKKIIADAGEDETVYDFFQDENSFYIATSKGLLIRKFLRLPSPDASVRGVGQTDQFIRKTFSYNKEELSITKIFRDNQGTLYLGTNKTAFILDTKNLSIKTFNCSYKRKEDDFNFFNIPSSRIVSMAEGNWNDHDVLWICPYGHGVGVFDKKTWSGMVSTLNIPDNMENLVRKVFVDSKNNCWLLCAAKGLGQGVSCPVAPALKNLWTKENFQSKTILLDSAFLRTEFAEQNPAGSFSLRPNNLYDMIENTDGTYWITSSTGLFLFNPDLNSSSMGKLGGTFTSYSSDHPDMNGLMKDKNENLWIIVSGGLEFFDVKKKQFHFFGFKEGIPGEGVQRYFYRGHDGFVYAGGNGYFIRFRPEEIKFNLASPEIAITHFKIFDKPSDSLLLQQEINLSYRKNFFSFEFAALNYTDPDANQYAYQLEGVDHDWVFSGNRNFASYTNLHGGHYVFRVKAANNNGVWNEEGMSVPVYIKPPLWQYVWFYPSLILIFVVAGFFIYRNRVQRLRKQQEEKLRTEIEAQEHERVRIAQDLHDDFGTRISALKIYMSTLEKYLDTKSEEAVAVQESARSIVNEAMTDLRTLLMNLSPKTLEMHGFHAAVHDLVNRLNHTGMFEVELDVDHSVQRFDKKSELALYRITQELLNNSIKHSQCTEISIQLLQRDGMLVLTYSDNGKGFDKSQLKEKGFGLKNIENRVSLTGGKIFWDTAPGRGISVTVEVPNNPTQ